MAMQPGPFSRRRVDEDHASAHGAVLLTDELMRRSVGGQLVSLEKANRQYRRVYRRVELNLFSRRAVYITTSRAKMNVGPMTIPLGTPTSTRMVATTASPTRNPIATSAGRAWRLRHERNIIAAASRQATSRAARRT